MAFDIEMIKKVYAHIPERVDKAREIVGRPLTLAEKILYAHLWEATPQKAFERGKDYVDFAPDRIACQDATAQMALLQFMHAGSAKVAVPTEFSGEFYSYQFREFKFPRHSCHYIYRISTSYAYCQHS